MPDSRTPADAEQPAVLDELDRAIVRQLQRNGRLTNTEIGRELSVTEATIRKRMHRLIDEGLIQVLAVPTPLVSQPSVSAIIGISAQLSAVSDVAEHLRAQPEVRYAGISVGRYDLVIEAVFSDQEHLLRFVTDGLGAVEGISAAETSMILKVAKFTYEWELP